MLFIFGPLYSGKRTVAASLLGCDMDELPRRAVWDVQELSPGADLSALADKPVRIEFLMSDADLYSMTSRNRLPGHITA